MKRLYLALAAAGAFLILPLSLALSTCSDPAPSPAPLVTPRPESRAESVAQATATASQTVKVTIHRKPTSQDAPQATKQGGPGGLSLNGTDGSSTAPTDGESITIEVSQVVGVAAGATASVSDHFADASNMVPAHGRIGVIAATMPGVFALDAQILRMDVPPWLLGVPLELGLDAAVNLEAGALGVTAGGKAFAGAFYWTRWNLSDHGPALAVGLRF